MGKRAQADEQSFFVCKERYGRQEWQLYRKDQLMRKGKTIV